MPKVFISYSHSDRIWVWGRLKPCVEAGGAKVLIDAERFKVGIDVVGQMDAAQDQADVQLLVITKPYLASKMCTHEMDRAVRADPRFKNGCIVPIRIDDARWPAKITRPDPLYVDLSDDKQTHPWTQLLGACACDLGTTAPPWLAARDEIVRWMRDGQSVNLQVDGQVRWLALLEHLRGATLPVPLLPDLKLLDLNDPDTYSRPGLIKTMIGELGATRDVPAKPSDCAALKQVVLSHSFVRMAMTRFDLVTTRRDEYGLDLFGTLRYLAKDVRKLGLLIVSRAPLAALLPPNNPASELEMKTVKLDRAP